MWGPFYEETVTWWRSHYPTENSSLNLLQLTSVSIQYPHLPQILLDSHCIQGVSPPLLSKARSVFLNWLIENIFLKKKSSWCFGHSLGCICKHVCVSVYVWPWWERSIITQYTLAIWYDAQTLFAKAISVQTKVKHSLLVENMWIADAGFYWLNTRQGESWRGRVGEGSRQ